MVNTSQQTIVLGRTLDESVVPKAPESSAHRRPNIVMWVLDDVGYGNLSPYGGLVEMPALQRIADRGIRFSNAHVTPLCSPTRTCLLTGRNHHTNHMPAVPRFTAGLPNQDARIPRENGFLSEILLKEGYATFCIGKWHLSSVKQLNPASPRDGWPLGRGFERFYGFMAGQTSQFDPHLCIDNGVVYPPRLTREDYHLSADLVDIGTRYVKELRSGSTDKPFFMYLAFGASHAPHHAPREWIDRYRGHFDMGWDEYRRIVHARQQEMGLIPQGSPLSQRDPDVPAWAEQSPEQQAVFARFMEAFAGMTSHMDHQVGRLLDELDAMGELDNTIFVVVSDNGASSEGGVLGAFNNQQFQGQVDQVPARMENIDDIGGPNSYNHYPWGWGWAGNTPFRRWKRETYRGGCAVPFVVSWPEGLPAQHGIREGFVHAIDLVPSVLELLDVKPPETLAGVRQSPIEGTSFASHLRDASTPSLHRTQYYEMMGHRAMYHDGWRAVCPWPGPSFKEGGRGWPADLFAADLERLERTGWELYHVNEDPAETTNLAAREPQRLREMISRWWHEAGRYGVLPILGRPMKQEKSADEPVSRHDFYPDTAPLFIEAAPNVINTNWRISAEVDVPEGDTDGMILAHGGKFGGYGFYVQDRRLQFVYNYLGVSQTIVAAEERLKPGRHLLEASFQKTGAPQPASGLGAAGVLRLLLDDRLLAEGKLDTTAPVMLSFSGMFTCGYHHAERFGTGYEAPFRFQGRIRRVQVHTHGAREIDADLAREVFLKRQ